MATETHFNVKEMGYNLKTDSVDNLIISYD
jgi:hypothetical protein